MYAAIVLVGACRRERHRVAAGTREDSAAGEGRRPGGADAVRQVAGPGPGHRRAGGDGVYGRIRRGVVLADELDSRPDIDRAGLTCADTSTPAATITATVGTAGPGGRISEPARAGDQSRVRENEDGSRDTNSGRAHESSLASRGARCSLIVRLSIGGGPRRLSSSGKGPRHGARRESIRRGSPLQRLCDRPLYSSGAAPTRGATVSSCHLAVAQHLECAASPLRAHARTTTVPVIVGCSEQKYGKLPARSKVR